MTKNKFFLAFAIIWLVVGIVIFFDYSARGAPAVYVVVHATSTADKGTVIDMNCPIVNGKEECY